MQGKRKTRKGKWHEEPRKKAQNKPGPSRFGQKAARQRGWALSSLQARLCCRASGPLVTSRPRMTARYDGICSNLGGENTRLVWAGGAANAAEYNILATETAGEAPDSIVPHSAVQRGAAWPVRQQRCGAATSPSPSTTPPTASARCSASPAIAAPARS